MIRKIHQSWIPYIKQRINRYQCIILRIWRIHYLQNGFVRRGNQKFQSLTICPRNLRHQMHYLRVPYKLRLTISRNLLKHLLREKYLKAAKYIKIIRWFKVLKPLYLILKSRLPNKIKTVHWNKKCLHNLRIKLYSQKNPELSQDKMERYQ